MVDTLGLSTVFFIHIATNLQWPELAQIICHEDAESSTKAVIENPALADRFFYHRQTFVETFYIGILGATDYCMRFEWQDRGSPHVHSLAWLPNAPDVEQLLTSADTFDTVKPCSFARW